MKLETFEVFGRAIEAASRNEIRPCNAAGPSEKLKHRPPPCLRSACKSAIDHVAMVLSLNRRGIVIEANDKFYDLSRYIPSEVIGSDFRDFLFDQGLPPLGREIMAALRHQDIWRGNIGFVGKHEETLWADLTLVPQRDLRSTIVSFTLLGLDVTERKKAECAAVEERRLREEMECLVKDIVDTVPNGIVAYDDAGRVIFFNEAHKKLYGQVVTGIVIGQQRSSLVTPNNEKLLLSPKVHRRKSNAVAKTCCRTFVQKLPGNRWIQVQNRRSSAGRLISVQTDVTGLKRAEKHIKQQATRDPLTGLCNRTALFNRLAQSAASDKERRDPCALLLIDLDGFKGINDTYGHNAGDTFLQQFAQNLRSSVRRSDTVARLGGDEFGILLQGLETVAEIVSVLEKLKRASAKPISIGNRTLIPSASIGVACFPRDGTDPKELLKCADHALYHCKKNDIGGFSLYDMSMRRQLARRAYLSEELRLTLERNEIGVVLQPQRDMTNGRHFGFEALVRWSVMDKWIPPLEIISIAEEAGLVKQLSYQIIKKTLGIIARLKDRGLEPGVIAFNTVASQLYDPEFPETLLRILSGYDVSPHEVELEVTENVILGRSADVISKAIHDLHAMGFGIALDDFGTGYASLTHLQRFPLDRLKIDRSFISGTENDDVPNLSSGDDFIISRTIVSLAHNLGLTVVAEGIETRRQYDELSNMGCDIAQGYLIGLPMIEEDIIKYMSDFGKVYFI